MVTILDQVNCIARQIHSKPTEVKDATQRIGNGGLMAIIYSPEWFKEKINQANDEVSKWPKWLQDMKPIAVTFHTKET